MDQMKMAMTIANNLELERTKLGLTQAQFAKELEMSLSSYKRIISGETNRIDIYIGYLIYKLTGRYTCELAGYNDPYLETAKKLKLLSPLQLKFIDALVDTELSFNSKPLPQGENYDDYITVLIPTGNMNDGMILDSCNYEKVNVSKYKKMFGTNLNMGIRITSNHLNPVYFKGETLLVSRSPIRDGDTGIFINIENNRAYIRKFYQTSPCQLVPINDYGDTFYVDDNNIEDMKKWMKFGYVLTKIR